MGCALGGEDTLGILFGDDHVATKFTVFKPHFAGLPWVSAMWSLDL